MKFTPELEFNGGKIRPLSMDDIDHLWNIYQHPELPGQSKPSQKEHMSRIIDFSVKMAATQRGMMWLIESENDVLGMVSVFDWQPSALRLMLRVDGLPHLRIEQRQAALQCAMDFLAQKFHTRNFAYQWVEGQPAEIQTMLVNMGYELRATLRDAWRVGNDGYANLLQYHFLNHQEKPKAGRMGEFENPAQNLNKDVQPNTEQSATDKEAK